MSAQRPAFVWEPLPGIGGASTLEHRRRSGWSWRMVAVALPGGGLALVNPVHHAVEATAGWLRDHGGVRFVLAPNHFHYLGVPETLAAFPGAELVASAAAVPRLAEKLGREVACLEGLAAALPDGVTLLAPPGMKAGEVWLRLDTAAGVAWVVCDAFFNGRGPLRGAFGLGVRLAGAGPGLRLGTTFKLLAVGDRGAYRAWLLERLAADGPRILVPGHGDVLADDGLAERLTALVRRRL